MYNSKLINLLRKLSKQELKRFGAFVRSPYFNKNTEFITFFEFLLPFGPKFLHKKIEKEHFLKNFNREKETSGQSLAYWMNGVIQLLEQFLIAERLSDDKFQEQRYLIESYQKLSLFKEAGKIFTKTEKNLNLQTLRNANLFHEQYQLLKTSYSGANRIKRVFNEQLQLVSNSLDRFYIVEKLRYCCEMLNYKNILNVEYDLQLGNEGLKFIDEHPLAEIPVVKVYLNILKMLQKENSDTQFQKTRSLVVEHEQVFTIEEIKELYTSILNYCTRQINQFNDEKYWNEYLEINKALLEKGLLFEKDQLSPWRYTNLVNVGLKTGQIDWTKSFIELYKEKLPEDYVESMYAYNLGLMYYSLKDYKAAQGLIFNIETKDILLNILNRSLQVKIYYESEQIELLLFSLEANRIFLLRNKLIDSKLKSQMKQFIDFAKKLAKIDSLSSHKLKPLKMRLPDASEVMHRDWLLQQIEQKIKTLLK